MGRDGRLCANVPIKAVDTAGARRIAGKTGKADEIALPHCGSLKLPILGRSGNHDVLHPFKDLFALFQRPTVKVDRQMPGEAATFRAGDIANGAGRSAAVGVGELGAEVAGRAEAEVLSMMPLAAAMRQEWSFGQLPTPDIAEPNRSIPLPPRTADRFSAEAGRSAPGTRVAKRPKLSLPSNRRVAKRGVLPDRHRADETAGRCRRRSATQRSRRDSGAARGSPSLEDRGGIGGPESDGV